MLVLLLNQPRSRKASNAATAATTEVRRPAELLAPAVRPADAGVLAIDNKTLTVVR